MGSEYNGLAYNTSGIILNDDNVRNLSDMNKVTNDKVTRQFNEEKLLGACEDVILNFLSKLNDGFVEDDILSE